MINHKYRLFQKYTENDFTKEIGNWWINIKEVESVFWDESVFNVDGITNYDFLVLNTVDYAVNNYTSKKFTLPQCQLVLWY